jgi:hypothetical protein
MYAFFGAGMISMAQLSVFLFSGGWTPPENLLDMASSIFRMFFSSRKT